MDWITLIIIAVVFGVGFGLGYQLGAGELAIRTSERDQARAQLKEADDERLRVAKGAAVVVATERAIDAAGGVGDPAERMRRLLRAGGDGPPDAPAGGAA